ncbi:MAG: hypothetical protein IJX17_02115 [Clostridia bacterium]|nr:hypothetical protein [Clostridia bacterium]
MKKKSKVTIEELTKNEIQRLETENKFSNYEKEIAKYKKTIATLKEKDKLYTKAFALCENKINLIKETSLDSLLLLCENLKEIKNTYLNECEGIENDEIKTKFLAFDSEFQFILDSIYDVCDKIEDEAHFNKVDKKVIPNKFELKEIGDFDDFDQFDEMKKAVRENIAKKNAKDNAKKDKSSKNNDEIDFDELNNSFYGESNDNIDKNFNDGLVSEKFNKMFYETPSASRVSSNITPSEDSEFDFNEALNPTLSLSDIMNDLMALDEMEEDDDLDFEIDSVKKNDKLENSLENKKNDEVLNETEEDKIKNIAEKMREEREQKVENAIANHNEKITRRDNSDNDFEYYKEEPKTREEYEKKFTYLQSIFKNLK